MAARATGTALVTGASAGLGVHFAHALAAEGYGLILTARRIERLEALAKELRDRHGAAVSVIPADLGAPGAVAALIGEVARRGLAVNLLVNNAGFGLNGAFAELDGPAQARMIELNCRAPVELAHAVLPGMIQMRSGAILNIVSTAAFQPGPWMAVYYASKAFLLSFSEALHEEVRHQGVRVTALCPGPTRTDFFEAAGMGNDALLARIAADPEGVVRDGLAALGANRAVRVSGLGNRLLALTPRLGPRWLVRRAVGAIQRNR